MHAVHEQEALERRVWLSMEAQEALPGLSALAVHDRHSPTLAHARQTARAGDLRGGSCVTERWRGGSALHRACAGSHLPSFPQS